MKRLLVVFAALALVGLFASAVSAGSPVRLLVNGREIEPDVPPQLINGRVVAPVRWVAAALGADVTWEEATRTVRVNVPQLESLERQITLLHNALAPTSPREAVEKWATGVKTRNGALQYAVLSPELKEKMRPEYEECGWVTGVSSPWVERCEITRETKKKDGAWECEVRFEMMASTGPAGSYTARVTVKQYERHWFVAQIMRDDALEHLQEQVTKFLTEMYGKHYRLLKTEVSCLSHSAAASGVEALFSTTVAHVPAYKEPEQWPVQQGRIKFLEENRGRLTPEQVRRVEEKIDFWNRELRQYIDKPDDANMLLKVTAGLDIMGGIRPETIKFYYEDPAGAYLPFTPDEWPAFKSSEELIKQGYEEMRRLVE